MPAIVFLFAGTKNFCPGTRMARSYRVCWFTAYAYIQTIMRWK